MAKVIALFYFDKTEDKKMNNIDVFLDRCQVQVNDLTGDIKLLKLEQFDMEQVKNFKKFNYDTLVVHTDSYELNIKKSRYALRIYQSCVRFTLKK